MHYDIERDPGRTHETDPTGRSPDPNSIRAIGARATVMAKIIHSMNPQPIGGGVSLQETIAQVAALQRAIQDQTRMINDFMKSNTDTMQLVRAELKGSTKGYDQQMLTALSQSETSLRSSLTALQQASGALDRVRAI